MKRNITLNINNLKTHINTDEGIIRAVNGVDLTVYNGEMVGLVGESGCGKSITALSILRLLPSKIGKIVNGEIIFKGISLINLSEQEMRKVRGKNIAMIFQDPMTSFNPSISIGEQISEALRLHQGLSFKEAYKESIEMLKLVKIPNPEKRYFQYPHQFSGGMRQRMMIAMALSCKPDLLIADEPTTALDVTIQAQIIELLKELISKMETSVILITHDLYLVKEICNRVYIMYSGLIVESAETEDIFSNPLHPYTKGLLGCLPRIDEEKEYLNTIPGSPTEVKHEVTECPFRPRCAISGNECSMLPNLEGMNETHLVRCWKA